MNDTYNVTAGDVFVYNCCAGRGCRHCRPSRPPFGFNWLSVAFARYVIRRNARNANSNVKLRADNKAMLKRIEALESRPITPVCTATHEIRYIRSERLYFFTWLFGAICAVIGVIGSSIAVNYFRSTVVTDDTPLGWIATSIADSTAYAWLFGIAATFVVTAIGMMIGYIIDRFLNVRTAEELTGPVTR